MPTLDDLHEALQELAGQAPAALTEPIRSNRRRRWAAVGLAAACTAAIAIAVPIVRGSDAGTPAGSDRSPSQPHHETILPKIPFDAALPAPAVGESPVLAYGFAIPDVVAGYTVIPDEITDDYQHATVFGPTDPPGGQVFVFYGAAFDPSTLTNREPVDVNGAAGYYADVQLPGLDHRVRALAWPYADDGWAIVRLGVDIGNPSAKGGDTASETRAAAAQSARAVRNELLLADAMTPAHDPLRTPVRIPQSSPPVFVQSLASGGPDGGLGIGTITSGVAAADWQLGWSPGTLSPADKPHTSTITINGREWIIYTQHGTPSALGLVADGWGMTVTPSGTAGLAEMEQFVAGLQFAPVLADHGTWFDAGTNLP